MTTYVLGAGASYHAGYPLCAALWAEMTFWAIESQPDPTYRQAIDTVVALNGPVTDVEEMFTNLDNGRGVFQALAESQRAGLEGAIRRCLKNYFKFIAHQRLQRAEVLLCCSGSNETLTIEFENHGFGRVTSVGTFADFVR